jgi:hypothetical protein
MKHQTSNVKQLKNVAFEKTPNSRPFRPTVAQVAQKQSWSETLTKVVVGKYILEKLLFSETIPFSSICSKYVPNRHVSQLNPQGWKPVVVLVFYLSIVSAKMLMFIYIQDLRHISQFAVSLSCFCRLLSNALS